MVKSLYVLNIWKFDIRICFEFRPARPCLFGQSASTASSSEAGANRRHNVNRAMAGGYSNFGFNIVDCKPFQG
jgi:hypothetical protein